MPLPSPAQILPFAPLLILLAASSSAQPQAFDAPLPSDPGIVSLRIEKVYYDVEGETPDALAAQLVRYGPQVSGKRYFGLTEWEVNAEYRWVRQPIGCSVHSLFVQASVQTHLPRWGRSAAASRELRGAWNRFLHALDWHEHGHRALAEEAAEAIRVRLAALHAPSCAHLEAQAHRAVIVVLNEYETYNNAYDVATDHGRSQGAVWPPRLWRGSSP